ncbi:MAG TPA: flagellar basal body rod protein FlgC [Noviherbaspirillum sp.]
MDYNASFQISASGMAIEKLRLDVAASNIANMHSSAASTADLYRPLRVVSEEVGLEFTRQFDALSAIAGGARVTGVEALTTPPRLSYEPGHPHADAKGYVAYPGINHVAEMVDVSNALRSYEANVVAMNAAKTMAAHALEIGGQS